MKLLLDTHVWLWSALEPGRLGSAARSALENRANEICISPLSLWELVLLVEKGRVELGETVEQWAKRALAATPILETPLTFEVVNAVRRISLTHRDPADRLLAATALAIGAVLLTADERLLACREIETLSAR